MSKPKVQEEVVTGWAWEIKVDQRWELCRWMMPSREQLIADRDKPSPEARAVCVTMRRRKA